jgi:hypothetical protein
MRRSSLLASGKAGNRVEAMNGCERVQSSHASRTGCAPNIFVDLGLTVLAPLAGFLLHGKFVALGDPDQNVTHRSDLPVILLD